MLFINLYDSWTQAPGIGNLLFCSALINIKSSPRKKTSELFMRTFQPNIFSETSKYVSLVWFLDFKQLKPYDIVLFSWLIVSTIIYIYIYCHLTQNSQVLSISWELYQNHDFRILFLVLAFMFQYAIQEIKYT